MTKARSNAVANAAKGDLTVGNGTDLSGILAVGSNGDTLVADSSTSTGLRYTGGTVQANPVLNSAMQIWQRGTSFSVTSGSLTYLTSDRWQAHRGATGATVSRQTTSDTTNLPFIQYCSRVQRDNANAATNAIGFFQNFESVNSIPFAGKIVTMSFYARAGANYSQASSGLGVFLLSGTGTDQNAINGLTGSVNVISQTATLTTTWQRFTYSATIGATATQIVPYFVFTPVGTAGAADYYEITGVQIDIGSVALPFRTYAATIQGELAACQRYYAKSYSQGTAPQTNTQTANLQSVQSGNVANVNYFGSVEMPVIMRTAPTVTIYSYTSSTAARVSDGAGTDLAANSGTTNFIGDRSFNLFNQSGGTLTASTGGFVFHYVASAEL
jgi:hypothetical protein